MTIIDRYVKKKERCKIRWLLKKGVNGRMYDGNARRQVKLNLLYQKRRGTKPVNRKIKNKKLKDVLKKINKRGHSKEPLDLKQPIT